MSPPTWICLVLLCLSLGASAEGIYRHVDNQGRVTFSDRRWHDGYVPLVNTGKGWRESRPPENLHEARAEYRPLILRAAERHQLSPALLLAVIHAESHFNPLALSSRGAVGLMQLMPDTAKRFGVYDRQDAKQNIEGGSRYLRVLLDMFEGDTALALAAYNAGEQAVLRRGKRIPPFAETEAYVTKVLGLEQRYRAKEYEALIGQR